MSEWKSYAAPVSPPETPAPPPPVSSAKIPDGRWLRVARVKDHNDMTGWALDELFQGPDGGYVVKNLHPLDLFAHVVAHMEREVEPR